MRCLAISLLLPRHRYRSWSMIPTKPCSKACWRRTISPDFDYLAILLHESPDRIVQQVNHRIRWSAQTHALRRDNDRTVDKNWMRHHEIEQFVVSPFGIVQTQLLVRRAFLAHERTHRDSDGRDQFLELVARWRRLEIFDDDGLNAALPDHGKGIARRSASRIVIDRDTHGPVSAMATGPRTLGRPSSQFISSMPAIAPQSSARMNPGRSMGRMPEKVFVSERAIATAGLANDVDAVNQ